MAARCRGAVGDARPSVDIELGPVLRPMHGDVTRASRPKRGGRPRREQRSRSSNVDPVARKAQHCAHGEANQMKRSIGMAIVAIAAMAGANARGEAGGPKSTGLWNPATVATVSGTVEAVEQVEMAS